jgi:hypothetical protein
MRFYEASTDIEATPEAVWQVLVDADAWPTWDSGVESVDGRLAPGEKIAIRSSAAPGRAFPVRVTVFEPPRRLVFRGGMPLGLFTGERTYSLEPIDESSTRLRMREEYTGIMVPLMWKSMPDLQPSFDQFVNGLKQKVEGS